MEYMYDVDNGILLCPGHHKFFLDSFHKNPIFTMEWLKKHHNDIYFYLFEKTKKQIEKKENKNG